MSPKKKSQKKISVKEIQSKESIVESLGEKDRFYKGIRWGIFLSLFGNLLILIFYDSVVKYFLKDEKSRVFLLIITAIILFILLTFLKDKEIKASDEKDKEATELVEMKENA